MSGEEIHLVRQDVTVRQDKVLGLVWHIGGKQQQHARLFGRTPGLALIAAAAGGDDIHPDIGAALRYRFDVITGEALRAEFIAAVAAYLAVAVEQFAVGEWWRLVQTACRQGLALDGDDAVGSDRRALTGDAGVPANEGETFLACIPGDQIFCVVEERMLPSDPAMGLAVHVQSQDHWASVAMQRAQFGV
jgi:hypothetical protein